MVNEWMVQREEIASGGEEDGAGSVISLLDDMATGTEAMDG